MKNIFTFIFFCFTLYTSAQEFENNPKVKWGPVLKDPATQLLTGDANAIIMYDGISYKLYDETLNLKPTPELKFTTSYKDKKLYALSSSSTLIGDKIIRFYYDPDLKTKSTDFYYQLFDKNSLEPLGDVVLFYSNTARLSLEFFRGGSPYFLDDPWKKNAAFFVAGTSPDHSKVCAVLKSKEKDTKNEEYHAFVFDTDMKLIWEKMLNLRLAQKDIYAEGFLLDNTGNLYLQADVNPSNEISPALKLQLTENPSPREQSGKETIFAFMQGGEAVYTYEIPKQGMHFGAAVSNPQDGVVYAAGLYSDDDPDEVTGFYCLQIDLKSKKILQSKHQAFTAAFIGTFPKEMKNKKEDALKNFYLEKICFGEEQSVYIIASYWNSTNMQSTPGYTSFSSTGTTQQHSGTYTPPTFTSGSFIVVKLTKEFSVSWIGDVPKFYCTSGDDEANFHDFFCTTKDNKLYLFYNDSPLNNAVVDGGELNKKSFKVSSTNEASATLVTIAPDGKWSKEILFQSYKEQGRRLLPLSSALLNNDTLFLYTIGNKYQLAEFPLN
ncbi:MAG TPA: hypothetical protein VE978_20410 [Chitinophagales bacterium]|nr:hypothetical protein [Chitinophagales bacterium]